MPRDPRTEAEKARAALARNAEMGTAVPKSRIEQEPSVTPRTFGEKGERARVRAVDQGLEAGGVKPESNDPDETSPAAAEQGGRKR